MGLTPSGPRLFLYKLHTRAGETCQRLLTLCHIRKVKAGGGVLDGGQRQVDHERISKVLDAIGSEAVAGDAANGRETEVSAAADTFLFGQGAEHLSVCRAVFSLRASMRLCTPDIWLPNRPVRSLLSRL